MWFSAKFDGFLLGLSLSPWSCPVFTTSQENSVRHCCRCTVPSPLRKGSDGSQERFLGWGNTADSLCRSSASQALSWLSSPLLFSGNFCHHNLILHEGLHEEINQGCSLATEKHVGLFTRIYNDVPLPRTITSTHKWFHSQEGPTSRVVVSLLAKEPREECDSGRGGKETKENVTSELLLAESEWTT